MPISLFTRAAEVHLMEMLEDLRDRPSGWQAIHFHLSSLLEQYKNEYQIKIAVNLIHDLLKNYEGGIFLLADSSIIVLTYGLEKTVLSKLIFQLRYLYMDDPLAYNENGQENPEFSALYDLRRSWKEFFELCSKRMAALARRPAIIDAPPPPERGLPRLEEKPAPGSGLFSGATLANVERDLAYADLYKAIRRQPVCAVLPNMTIRRVFDELYIHIAHLRQTLKSPVDFLSNRWLFKYLTHLLDNRMLELIRTNPGQYLKTPVSINLNVETLLSSQFDEFDAALSPQAKVGIVIEVPVVDVYADMTAFKLACAEVQQLGYRVCLDGLTAASFTSISRDRLGVDLVKVQWNADPQSDITSSENLEIAEAVRVTGTNRVILCRCDKRSAVEYGQALGISLFQGRYLDSLLNPTSKVEN